MKVPLVRLENSDATVLKNINATLATYQAEQQEHIVARIEKIAIEKVAARQLVSV